MPVTQQKEKAIIVAIAYDSAEHLDTLAELHQLAYTAGAEVVDEIVQQREKPDVAYYVGKGKAQEIRGKVAELSANLIFINDEITPVQKRNLEHLTGVRVLDRTELILDIFAQRARSREGMLQVELAQLEYLLPRLTGKGVELSRLGGGIGTRGPGETKLEYDRRRIRKRITTLQKRIQQVRKHRTLHRKARGHLQLPLVVIVGYTNTGKSTLLNALTNSGVYVDAKLFATLDPTTRKVALPSGWAVLLTDTVGFIKHLPHQLIAAFKATLEEVTQADILIHVVDASHPQAQEQCTAVYSVLEELGAKDKPIIIAFNKIDKVQNLERLRRQAIEITDSVLISALYGDGLSDLLNKLVDLLRHRLIKIRVGIPHNRGDLIAYLYEKGRVLEKTLQDNQTIIGAEVTREVANRFKEYFIE